MASLGGIKFEFLLEIGDSFSQSVQIEVVSDIILVDLDEELVALEVAEPLDPARPRFTFVFVVNVSCNNEFE
jgi:hypothetical protein